MEASPALDSHTSANAATIPLVIVGSVGIDTIETPRDKREGILGGSASYACAAASFFTGVGMVGVVGTDFPERYHAAYKHFKINTEGLQVRPGETFRWSGVYEANMDNRRTISTELNVFATFSPELPQAYTTCPYLFLGNISPGLQMHVLDQVAKPRFVVLDTMDLWINVAKEDLLKVIRRVTMLTLNESEARHLSGEHALVKAARKLLSLGPKYVLIKKGEHGSILFSKKSIFMMPAFLLEDVVDPTGAGDTFAGGFLGALARSGAVSQSAIRKAMVYGSVVASFGVEDFSLDRLGKLTLDEIEARAALFRKMTRA
jgi:sugar/nucleoside kinase (ribokinase family)